MSSDSGNELEYPAEMPKHQVYELVVKRVVERLEPNAKVRHNVQVPVVGDERTRQVDVYVEGLLGGFPFTAVIDAKYFGKPLDVGHVDKFLGMLDDIKPNVGVLVSLNGFGAGAKKRAAKEARRLNLCSVFLGGEPEFSAPIGVGLITVKRDDVEFKAQFMGGHDFIGPISRDPKKWTVVDENGAVWSLDDLVVLVMNLPACLDKPEGAALVPNEKYKMVCTDGSVQAFDEFLIQFRSKVTFFSRSLRFDSGAAILNEEGAIIASEGLEVTVDFADENKWEEISREKAEAGLVAELSE